MTREDYIKNLQSMIDDAEDMGLYEEDVESLQMAIEALEQEPKMGHWIMLGGKEEIYCEEAKCSICGSVEVNAGYDNYCPNCGAKMEREDGK